jgi:hypothetical protein
LVINYNFLTRIKDNAIFTRACVIFILVFPVEPGHCQYSIYIYDVICQNVRKGGGGGGDKRKERNISPGIGARKITISAIVLHKKYLKKPGYGT